MIIYVLFLSFFLCVCSLGLKYRVYAYRRILSLQVVFLVYWSVILFFTCFRLFGLYEISKDVLLAVYLGLLGFFTGQMTTTLYSHRMNNKEDTTYKSDLGKFKISFYLLLVLAVIVSLMKIRLLVPTIRTEGVSRARDLMQLRKEMNLTGIWDILLFYFAKPYIRAVSLVLIVDMMNNKRKTKNLMVILVLVMIAFFSDGGRGIILDIIIAMAYLIWIKKVRINKKISRRLTIAILISIIIVLAATKERGVGILSTLYIYYCGGLNYFSQALYSRRLFSTYLYGMACFQGFFKPLYGFLGIIGINEPNLLVRANEFLLGCQSYTVYVAPAERMNYFMTTFGYAYKDGGYIGVFVVHYVLSIICAYMDKLSYLYPRSTRIISLKANLLSGILFTMSIFPFAKYYNVVTYVYIYLITSHMCSRNKSII